MGRGVPLTGADCFLRAFDAEIGRLHGASHVSQLVLRLGPGLDVEALRREIDRVVEANPILRAPIGRPFGLGAPVYRTDRPFAARPPIEVHDAAPDGGWPEVFFRCLNQHLDTRRGPLLRFDAVRRPDGGCDLAMSWLHLLFDGSGSEGFLRWLEGCRRGERRADEPPEAGSPEPATALRERGRRATAWQRHVQAFDASPPHSLAGPPTRTPQALRYRVLRLEAAETVRAVAEAQRRAGFLTPMLFYLAAVIRAHHAVHRARGSDPGSALVPLPVNVRPKGAEGAVFRTHVSLLWFQVRPERVDDFDALIADLKEQRLAAVRGGLVESGLDAMDFARYAPRRLYARMARRHAGELCSFFFAWTGEFLAGVDRFFGAEVQDGFHAAPVPPSPGSCMALSLRAGRLNAVHVLQEGVFEPDELALFDAQLRSDLLGAAEGARGRQRGTSAR